MKLKELNRYFDHDIKAMIDIYLVRDLKRLLEDDLKHIALKKFIMFNNIQFEHVWISEKIAELHQLYYRK